MPQAGSPGPRSRALPSPSQPGRPGAARRSFWRRGFPDAPRGLLPEGAHGSDGVRRPTLPRRPRVPRALGSAPVVVGAASAARRGAGCRLDRDRARARGQPSLHGGCARRRADALFSVGRPRARCRRRVCGLVGWSGDPCSADRGRRHRHTDRRWRPSYRAPRAGLEEHRNRLPKRLTGFPALVLRADGRRPVRGARGPVCGRPGGLPPRVPDIAIGHPAEPARGRTGLPPRSAGGRRHVAGAHRLDVYSLRDVLRGGRHRGTRPRSNGRGGFVAPAPRGAQGRAPSVSAQAEPLAPDRMACRAGIVAALLVLAGGGLTLNQMLAGGFYDDGLYVGTADAPGHGLGDVHPNLPGHPAVVHFPPLYPLLPTPFGGALPLPAPAAAAQVPNSLLAAPPPGLITWHASRAELLGPGVPAWLAAAVVVAAGGARPRVL